MIIQRFLLLFALLLCLNQAFAAQRVSQTTRDKLQRELPILGLSLGDDIFIRTFKKESRLELWARPQQQKQFILFRTYPICYYSGRLGPKLTQGDEVTPEGFYQITRQDLNPSSRFHLSLDIGYPNTYDQQLFRDGSQIKIHGACDAVGCFAMSNSQIEEIYYLVEQALQHGQEKIFVHSFPFHLTDQNLSAYKNSQWYDFWQQLQAGYRLFNRNKIPPVIQSVQGHYVVKPLQ